MKTKFRGILALFLALVVHYSYAQENVVSGTVTDPSGLPLPGVNVIVKNTNNGTQTDFDGKYSISANPGAVLTFSYIGFANQDVTVGSSATINVTMEESAAQLEEVVITALGIEREKKALGYATQEVSEETISDVPVENFANALSGEVAGLDIKATGTLGGGVNIISRGNSSITNTNQMLIVIDGIPIQNDSPNITGQDDGGGGFDYGNASADLNPNDIANINVLKGAAASALYGSRASNGAVIITTKAGQKSEGLGITVSSSLTVGTADESTIPEYQQEYGGGGFGALDFGSVDLGLGDGPRDAIPFAADASWGPAYDGRQVYHWFNIYPQLDTFGGTSAYVPGDKTPIDFFNTAITNVTTVALEKGGDFGNFRLGYTNFLQEGVIPNSEIKRNTFTFKGNFNITNKFTAGTSVTYTRTTGLGRYGTGYDAGNVMRDFRQWWQSNLVVDRLRDAYFSTRQNITWNPNSAAELSPAFFDNPYWTRFENFANDTRNRYLLNLNLNYEITDWLSILGRVTRDGYDFNSEERVAIGSTDLSSYIQRSDVSSETNYDLIASIDYNITDKLNLNANLGWNLRENKKDRLNVGTNGGLLVPDFYSLENSANPITSEDIAPLKFTKKVDGTFARASFGYDDTYFLEGTVRTDRSSALPRDNNRYWYYSASGSLVFSNFFKNTNWLNFGKLRANYAEVGSDTDPYNVNVEYIVNPSFFNSGSLTNPTTLNNPNLVEERTQEFEVGIETQLFNRRFGFDISYYNRETNDLITSVDVSAASGIGAGFLNAGSIKNEGVEVLLNVTPLQTNNFSWGIKVNWARNINTVEALAPGIEYLPFGGIFGVSIGAQVGELFGTIRGVDYVFDNNGNRVVNQNTGRYLTTSGQTNGSNNVLGDQNPDWLGGLRNTFTYKDFSFSFLIDVKQGGDVFSLDQYFGLASGLYPETAGLNELGNPQRDPVANGGGVLLDGVSGDVTFNPDGTYTVTNTAPNTVRTEVSDFAVQPYGWTRNAAAGNVYDASYVKLREVTLSYRLPQSLFDRLFIQDASLSLIGRNLWIIHKNLPYADPEAGLSSGNIQGLQTSPYPSVREIGASLKLKF